MLERPVIMDPSNWGEVLSIIWSGLQYLDSIVLFDTDGCHLTFLGFDIALMCFGIVWNTVGLWHYDFDEVYYNPYDEFADLDSVVSDLEAHNFYADVHNDESSDSESELEIFADNDKDFE